MIVTRIIEVKHRCKKYYDRQLNMKHFEEGEYIYLLKENRGNKFDKHYDRPYEITRFSSN